MVSKDPEYPEIVFLFDIFYAYTELIDCRSNKSRDNPRKCCNK